MKDKVYFIDLQNNCDDRGSMVIAEETKSIPFAMKRLFYIYGVNDDKTRGNHANIDSEFVMVAMQGSVKIHVDNGKEKETYTLDDPRKGLYIPKLTWKIMSDFSKDCILLVIASTLYNKEEYINDYDKFIEYVNK